MKKDKEFKEIKLTQKEYQRIYDRWRRAKKRGSDLPFLSFADELCDKITIIRSKEVHITKAESFGITQKQYRRAYNRWKAALKRGHDVPLDLFIKNGCVRLGSFMKKSKNYYTQKRLLQLALATPKWVDIEEISNFYANRPEGKEVDHDIPINGENVCGLHVISNLKYLTVEEHREKTRIEMILRRKSGKR